MIDLEHLLSMAHSPVRNYAIPGLTSWLIGNPSPCGTVRMFHCERAHQEAITPHSHRFDFQCLVLEGKVRNRLWKPVDRFYQGDGDWFQWSVLRGAGLGQYERGSSTPGRYTFEDHEYEAGGRYGMKADEIHSIYFDRNTRVLFFEGPQVSDKSAILEPLVDGECVPTFKVEPWMFQR